MPWLHRRAGVSAIGPIRNRKVQLALGLGESGVRVATWLNLSRQRLVAYNVAIAMLACPRRRARRALPGSFARI